MDSLPRFVRVLPIGIALLFIATSCGLSRIPFLNQAYHNTTARYNAYFIANERIKEVQSAINKNHKPNYNQVLRLYPTLDTTVTAGYKDALEDAYKKASIGITRHKTSDWVDDCYILIGQARYFQGDFGNAIETYKYVNSSSTDPNARHAALIKLMHTFIDKGEINNAKTVSDYLEKEELNKKNLKALYLIRAHLAQKENNIDNLLLNLNSAVPLMGLRDDRARIYFILGQIYQELGFEAEAYNNYQKVLKSNPIYELSFYSRLNMAQVYELKNADDLKKARKYFDKLLEDAKNKEYRDKIYYELAHFEMKLGHLNTAIDHFKASAANSINNNLQKSLAYWELGKIYYDSLANYELAKIYYDSTIQVMPQTEEYYQKVKKRQEVLADFVDQLNTIQLQDSLLTLANMDSASLDSFLDKVVTEEIEAQEALAKAAKREARRSRNFGNDNSNPFDANNSGPNASAGGVWYFYNPTSISTGQTEFRSIWGTRQYEDNWRRSQKAQNLDDIAATDSSQASSGIIEQVSQEDQAQAMRKQLKEGYYKTIPFSEQDQAAANKKLETAYYTLGNIYNFSLEEKDNAVNTFVTLLNRYENSDYEPEVLYQLYLLLEEKDPEESARFRDMLTGKHPKTKFAKIILNPNFREESNAANERVKAIYASAYRLYELNHLDSSMNMVMAGLADYPETDYTDNLAFLKILLEGKTLGYHQYAFALQNFPLNYPESELVTYTEDLLKTAQEYEKRGSALPGVNYYTKFDQAHILVLMYPNKDNLANEIPMEIDRFNKQLAGAQNLVLANLIFGDGYSLILVEEFDSKPSSLSYYFNFNGDNSPLSRFKSYNLRNFVISKDNFQLLYQYKDLESYLAFFDKHYD